METPILIIIFMETHHLPIDIGSYIYTWNMTHIIHYVEHAYVTLNPLNMAEDSLGTTSLRSPEASGQKFDSGISVTVLKVWREDTTLKPWKTRHINTNKYK